MDCEAHGSVGLTAICVKRQRYVSGQAKPWHFIGYLYFAGASGRLGAALEKGLGQAFARCIQVPLFCLSALISILLPPVRRLLYNNITVCRKQVV